MTGRSRVYLWSQVSAGWAVFVNELHASSDMVSSSTVVSNPDGAAHVADYSSDCEDAI